MLQLFFLSWGLGLTIFILVCASYNLQLSVHQTEWLTAHWQLFPSTLLTYKGSTFLFRHSQMLDEVFFFTPQFPFYSKQIWAQFCCGSAARKFVSCDEIVKSLKCLIPTLMKAALKIGVVIQTGKCARQRQPILVRADVVKYRATKRQ